MTTAQAQPASVVAPARSGPAQAIADDRPPGGRHPVARGVAGTLLLLVLLAVGFFVYLYGLSGLSEARAQTTMFQSFTGQLSQALAPVGPAKEGAPVAVLSIPAIGLRDVVVVEGTTSRDLTRGPGHVRASALPGQQGVSFLYGKSATFGAPFGKLMNLNRGDRITVITGQGTSTYVVESFGTSSRPAPADSANRLVLESAQPALVPSGAVQVSADLMTPPQPNPGGWPDITAAESYMATDIGDSMIPLMLWTQVLLVAIIAGTVSTNLWSRWPAYLVTAPVMIALLWCVYENLSGLLPNLY